MNILKKITTKIIYVEFLGVINILLFLFFIQFLLFFKVPTLRQIYVNEINGDQKAYYLIIDSEKNKDLRFDKLSSLYLVIDDLPDVKYQLTIVDFEMIREFKGDVYKIQFRMSPEISQNTLSHLIQKKINYKIILKTEGISLLALLFKQKL